MPPTLGLQTCLRASRPASLRGILSTRSLATTAQTLYQQVPVPGSDIPIPSPSSKAPEIPPYPYGPRQTYHQSNTGLYGSARIRFGNNVSEEHNRKTRRKWRPNVHHKRLWSPSLGVFVHTRVTSRVLRTIDKVGGLDEYLLGHKPQRVKDLGPWGWKLRWRIMQTPALRERFAREREVLGLPPKETGAPEDAALMAQTDKMLEDGAVFDLQDEEAEAPGTTNAQVEEGFMREERPTSA
ncbi:hypothetical protein VTK56DRAFT_9216 [Thermocarpiscus australiensis]